MNKIFFSEIKNSCLRQHGCAFFFFLLCYNIFIIIINFYNLKKIDCQFKIFRAICFSKIIIKFDIFCLIEYNLRSLLLYINRILRK